MGEEVKKGEEEMSVAKGGVSLQPKGPMTVPRIKSHGATRRFWPRKIRMWHFALTPASCFLIPSFWLVLVNVSTTARSMHAGKLIAVAIESYRPYGPICMSLCSQSVTDGL